MDLYDINRICYNYGSGTYGDIIKFLATKNNIDQNYTNSTVDNLSKQLTRLDNRLSGNDNILEKALNKEIMFSTNLQKRINTLEGLLEKSCNVIDQNQKEILELKTTVQELEKKIPKPKPSLKLVLEESESESEECDITLEEYENVLKESEFAPEEFENVEKSEIAPEEFENVEKIAPEEFENISEEEIHAQEDSVEKDLGLSIQEIQPKEDWDLMNDSDVPEQD